MSQTNPMTWRTRLKFWFIPFAFSWLIRLLYASYRKVFLGRDILEQCLAEKTPFILAIWHNNVLFSPIIHRDLGIGVMISPSADGEFIARTVERFGNVGIRGSSSRGGRAALQNMVKHLARGFGGAMTPDGPRGPVYEIKPGLLTAASRAGAVIIPFHYEADRQWLFRSWDQTKLPKWRARLVMSYGKPIHLPSDLNDEAFETWRLTVEKALNDNRERCQHQALSPGL